MGGMGVRAAPAIEGRLGGMRRLGGLGGVSCGLGESSMFF